jgi:polyferredoxin
MSERVAVWRRAVQALAFLATGQWLAMGFLRCPFGVPFVSCMACPLGDCSGRFLFLPAAIVALGGAVVFGRVFCGWICPLGFLQDAAGMVRGRRARPAPDWRVRSRHVIRLTALLLCVWLILRYNAPSARAYAYVVRSPTVWNWEAVRTAWAFGLARYPVRAVLLLVALLGALFIPRLWCRWLCPLGALLSVGNRFAPFGIRLRKTACTSCGACRRVCSVDSMPGAAECISCGECAPVCAEDAIAVPFAGPKRQLEPVDDGDAGGGEVAHMP